MQYLVSQKEMKQYDKHTMEYYKIPSLVLMERAALVTVEQLRSEKGNGKFKVLVVSGCGNNGGDGIAVGRLLFLQGCKVDFVLPGDRHKCSEETERQIQIVEQYGQKIDSEIPEDEYDIVIDAVFGIGLSREVTGHYKEAIESINRKKAYVCSIDIPSGVHGDSGQIMGCAVHADLTVTYGFLKLGHCFYPGADLGGKIVCRQMGIDERSFLEKKPRFYTYTDLKDVNMPLRQKDGNKGTFGKVLVVAGSKGMSGAALMTAASVFRMGAGMVKIVTEDSNREILQQALPEAMLTVYGEKHPQEETEKEIQEALQWADCIVIGPGIGTDAKAKWLLHNCLQKSTLPMVIDADALNLLAKEKEKGKDFCFLKRASKQHEYKIILTPHLGEFSRLFGCSIAQVKEHLLSYPKQLADETDCVVVCKDARTLVAQPKQDAQYVNMSGNSGMATAGAGDVLAGVIAGLLAQGMEVYQAAAAGVYLHGLAGDRAAGEIGEYSMMATDIVGQLMKLVKETGENK